ncbi:hypothetical protein [Cryobacterium algoritolerans]|nr:hypothetical protein [Cryobacterium algoritolerans]
MYLIGAPPRGGEVAGPALERTDLAHTAAADALVESEAIGKVLIDVSAG